MKKGLSLVFVVAMLVFVSSCSKKSSNAANSFTFKGQNFPIGLATRDTLHLAVTFTDANSDQTGTLTVFFPDSFPNTVGNTFQTSLETGFPYYSHLTKLQLTIGTRSYYPTGNGVTSIFYNLSSAKKLTIYTQSNDPIWMVGGLPGGTQDSAQLTINVNE